MKTLYVIILSALIQLHVIKAQSPVMDSLKNAIKTAKEDTSKVKTILNLGKEYYAIGSYDTAFMQAESARQLASKLSFKKGIALSYHFTGVIYLAQGNSPEALKNFEASLKINKEIGDKSAMAKSYNNIGLIYENQANYSEALKYHGKSLEFREAVGDKNGIAMSFNNIGNIYFFQGNYPEALRNHFKSLKIKEEIGDKNGIAGSYTNIGNIYFKQGNFSEAIKNQKSALQLFIELGNKKEISTLYNNLGASNDDLGNYQEAFKNYNNSLKIAEEIGDKHSMAIAYINLGNVNFKQANYAEALKNQLVALKIYEEIGNKDGIIYCYNALANIELHSTHNYKVAKSYNTKALLLANELGSLEHKMKSYMGLAKADSAMGNFQEAYKNYKFFIIYRDSITNEETKLQTMQSTMQYEFDKKELATKAEQERKDVLANEEKNKQKVITYSIGVGLCLVLLFALFVVKSLRQKQKDNQIIILQKQEVEIQKDLVEEKHREITDSINYAERIQRSFLATKEQLDEQLKDYFVFFQPKDVVSGDFYWAHTLQNGNFALVTADSTGHGVPGAIMSILNTSSLEKAVELGINEPAEILNHTRQTIIQRLKKDGSAEGGKDGMDCSLISFNKDKTKLIYSAANNPIWIVRNNELIEFSSDKIPVGKHERDSISFTQRQVELQKGDMIYTLTDGFPDQFGGPKGKKFMYKKLKEVLVSVARKPTVEQQAILKDTLKNWKGNTEQVDDVTVIGVRV